MQIGFNLALVQLRMEIMSIYEPNPSTPDSLVLEAHEQAEKTTPYQSLLPGLPDEVSELCLLRLPYPYHAMVRSVSSHWNRAITDPKFLVSKESLSLSLPYIFIFAYHRSSGKNNWQAFDPRSHLWFQLPPMPSPKAVCLSGFACASLPRQGKMFVMGGIRSDTETPMSSTFTYCASTNQWSFSSPMLTPRASFHARNLNGKIITVGGCGIKSTRSIKTVEVYDPAHDIWEEAAPSDIGLAMYASAVVGGKMYVTEGWTWPFRSSPRGRVYSPDEDKWSEMTNGMREGWSGVSFVVGDRLFALSEYGECPMKIYVQDCDKWQYVGGDKFPHEIIKRPFTVSSAEGKIYVVGHGLNMAIGTITVCTEMVTKVGWEVVYAPSSLQYFVPSNAQVLYA